MSCLRVTTELGEFEIELHSEQVPETTRYFTELAERGELNDAGVFRIVNKHNDQSLGSGYINAVQIGTSKGLDETSIQVAHESTKVTGLQHTKWAVSAARYKPGCLYKSFFICMDDEPHLDYGGTRQPDEQGFAVFGRVVGGYDVLEEIFARAEDNEILDQPIPIPRIDLVPSPCLT